MVSHTHSDLVLFSPAKINLFLRVMGKRPDGYHELASLFQAIDLGDTITLKLAKEDHLTCSDPTLPCNRSNLVLKAVDLFRRKSGLQFCVDIHLEKRIPKQAGLGGGSSNAATTLWGLNALHNHPYTDEELQAWSGEIGSDIPFFFSSGTAYCTGRGEKVRNIPPLELPVFSLVKPSFGLSTPEIYKAWNQAMASLEDPEHLLKDFYLGKPRFINDLEEPAFRLCPSLLKLKEDLGIKTVFMSGSGSALIAVGTAFNAIKCINRQHQAWY